MVRCAYSPITSTVIVIRFKSSPKANRNHIARTCACKKAKLVAYSSAKSTSSATLYSVATINSAAVASAARYPSARMARISTGWPPVEDGVMALKKNSIM